MGKSREYKKIVGLLVAMAVFLCSVMGQGSFTAVSAATKKKQQSQDVEYISVNDFIEKVIRAAKVKLPKVEQPYLVAAYETGILKDGEITSFNANITREQAALLINRVDEYMHGDTLEESYVNKILERRISDIKKVGKKYREAVAKVYGKGIVRGFSNGYGVQSRQFRGRELLTLAEAKAYIKKMKYPKYRAKLSPDAQLIRTTNLPKNADKFEYILECFPNEFYEKSFNYQYIISSTAPITEGDRYEFPINMRNRELRCTFVTHDMGEQMDLYLYDWADKIERFVDLTFNVSYKTIDEKWKEAVKEASSPFNIRDRKIVEYMDNMKSLRVSVKTRKIAVEPSTLYYSDGLYMRAYIEYKVVADKNTDELSDYLYCLGGNIEEFKLNQWITSYLDIRMGTNDPQYGDGSDYTASYTWYETDLLR